jgi:sec-independent protein translocase protein TatB
MFGIGLMEMILILIVSIISLGPNKLPNTLINIIRFFKKISNNINEIKIKIDKEINIDENINNESQFQAQNKIDKNI